MSQEEFDSVLAVAKNVKNLRPGDIFDPHPVSYVIGREDDTVRCVDHPTFVLAIDRYEYKRRWGSLFKAIAVRLWGSRELKYGTKTYLLVMCPDGFIGWTGWG